MPVYAFCRTTSGCYDEDSSVVLGSKGRASVKAKRIWGETTWRWQGQAGPLTDGFDHVLVVRPRPSHVHLPTTDGRETSSRVAYES